MKAICQSCKEKKLIQKGIKMSIGIGYFKIGECDECGKNNEELFSYSE